MSFLRKVFNPRLDARLKARARQQAAAKAETAAVKGQARSGVMEYNLLNSMGADNVQSLEDVDSQTAGVTKRSQLGPSMLGSLPVGTSRTQVRQMYAARQALLQGKKSAPGRIQTLLSRTY
jgi:hypothetical protein